jgi:hypothetical protein
MSRKQNLYLAQGGHLAAMSEFLCRGYNVAVPEVDVGDDVFVVRDEDGRLTRVQVKSAAGRLMNRQGAYQGLFSVPLKQVMRPRDPDLTFVFPVRYEDRWRDFLVIRRAELAALRKQWQLGGTPTQKGALVLRLVFTAADVICGGVSLQAYRNNWSAWPPVEH